ncbi:Aspartokinase [Linnemannia exigua]|uniref:Aspartokinase n=1 Tax=Linnemannia exigua TaxID=604196 RepID=A0AAD4D3P2_9FUNG|nr:Aspartokinase [Linnemannia exigua]
MTLHLVAGLLKAAASALEPGSTEFIVTVQDIRHDHLTAAREHISNETILQRVEREVKEDCSHLQTFLQAIQTIEEISPKSKDAIMAVGERLSCRIVAGILNDQGIEAQFVSLETVIDAGFDSTTLDQNFYDYLSRAFASALSNCGHRVPVVTGFFGPVPGSLLTSIGRGYTDLAAALLAVGLGAKELQIWKEVDGIFTADPRKVQGARLLDMITPEEASELTYYGSEVIHPFTMEQVVRARIPIRIKNVMKPSGAGTVIFPDQDALGCQLVKPWSSTPTLVSEPLFLTDGRHCASEREQTKRQQQHQQRPTAVTVKENIWVMTVHSNCRSLSQKFLAEVFSLLDRHGIAVDLISTSEVAVSMAMEGSVVEEKVMKEVVSGLSSVGVVEVKKGRSIVSAVGRGMKGLVGVSGRMISTIANVGVNVEMISQGMSEINVSCVVAEEHAWIALQAVHDGLLS